MELFRLIFYFYFQVENVTFPKRLSDHLPDLFLIGSSDDNKPLFQPFSSSSSKQSVGGEGGMKQHPPMKIFKKIVNRIAVKPKLGDPLVILFWKPLPTEILAKILSSPLEFQPSATMLKFKTKWEWEWSLGQLDLDYRRLVKRRIKKTLAEGPTVWHFALIRTVKNSILLNGHCRGLTSSSEKV